MAEVTDTYELTYIINAVLSEDQTKKIISQINEYITGNGGEVLEVDEWGTRRLSYPIEKKRNGYYVNIYFTAPGEMITKLERTLEIEDNIIRYLTIRYDAKMLRYYELRKQGAIASLDGDEDDGTPATSDDEDGDDASSD